MNIVYNSENYWVAEYAAGQGLELVDKHASRGTFFSGDMAEKFAQSMNAVIAEDPSVEHIDEFLGNFDSLLTVPVIYH